MKISIINGPNLNLLGSREVEVYGNQYFTDYLTALQKRYKHCEIDYFQSNVEGEIVTRLQEAGFDRDGIVLNAGAYSHTSIAIADAIAAIKTPVIEVHISNIYSREAFRHKTLLTKHCKGVITGFGLDVYRLSIEHFVQ